MAGGPGSSPRVRGVGPFYPLFILLRSLYGNAHTGRYELVVFLSKKITHNVRLQPDKPIPTHRVVHAFRLGRPSW